MSNYSPTIVAASLSDQDLKDSIDKLVRRVDEQSLKMAQNFDAAVQLMKESLQSLDKVKVSFGKNVESGTASRAKAQKEEISSTDKLIDKNKELASSYERVSQAKSKKPNYTSIQSDVDKSLTYLVNTNKDVDRQLEQIIQNEQRLVAEKQKEAQVTKEIATEQAKINGKYAFGNSSDQAGREEQQRQRLEQYKRALQEATSSYKTMQQVIANALHIGAEEVHNYDVRTASARQLNAMLKQQQDAYSRLTAIQRSQRGGAELAESIRRIKDALQKLQTQASRPTNLKKILDFEPRTLDEIVSKIQKLQAYRSGLVFTDTKQKKEIDDINVALEKLKKKQTEIMGSNKSLLDSNNALARSWNYMKNRLAFYFTVGASTQFVKNLIDVRSQYEMNERALGILINSAERGTQIFQELSNMALVSPYTLIELSSAAKQLTAYDIAAKDVVDTTRRLADMASAVGVPIERLTYALGQIKAYGYLNSRDARMFANAGIPLVKQLADYYTELEGKIVSTADVYDRMKKKAIDYNDVMQVINKMTDEGGKFFDFQAKMADTLKVRLANLTLAWNNMLNDIGKSNQNILTFGIGALKELFLHWKEFNNALTNVAWAAGIVIALRAVNVALVKSGVQWSILNKEMTAAGIAGTAVANKLKTVGSTLYTLAKSKTTWLSLLVYALVDATMALYNMNEAQKELNKSIRTGADDNYKNISKFLEQYKEIRDSLYSTQKVAIGSIYNPTTRKAEVTSYAEQQVGQDINSDEAKKAWEAMREQIELTSKNADQYISNLLRIENVSERLRKGFALLEDIMAVNAAIKELDDDTIKIDEDFKILFFTLKDGLLTNLKDLKKAEDELVEAYGSMEAAISRNRGSNNPSAWWKDYERELRAFQKDLDETTDSVLNFINLKGWSGDVNKITETFSQIFNKIALDNNLSPSSALQLRLNAANAEYKAIEEALQKHLEDERSAYEVARTQREKEEIQSRFKYYSDDLFFLRQNTAQSRVYWEDFLKWMGAEHRSEVQAMFRDQSAEQIKMLDFSKGEYNEWVVELAQKYAKEHGMSYAEVYNQLHNYILNANQWSIRIPLIITSEGTKGVYETLLEQDKLADAADQKIQRLKIRETDLINQGKKDSEEYTKTVNERKAAEKDLAKAEAEGGHSKKKAAAGKKAQKAAESELQKALKEEITLLDKVRSVYKSLTKEGVSSTEALSIATSGYDKTLKSVNDVLSKYGLSELKLTKYAGVQNPKAVMDMLQEQLNKLVKSGMVKPEEIKDLEVKLKDLKVDSVTFSQKTLVDSLNNELGKLKDEYELAIDLDANPELGETFADVIGINKKELDKLPKDFESVVTKMQAVMDEKLGSGVFDVKHNLNKKNLESWLTGYGYTADSQMAKELTSYIDYANKVRHDETKKQVDEWNKLLEKYAEYEYKRKQITDTYEREIAIAVKKNASDAIIKGIQNKRDQDLAKLDFDEFMKSPQWITATGDLASLSNKAIRGLIKTLEDYKKSAKNLSPKQIKQLNNALKNLYKEQRKGSPFKAISNMMEEAKNKMKEYDEEIKKTEKEMNELGRIKVTDGLSEEQETKLKSLRKRWNELKNAQQEAGDIDASQWVGAINETITAVQGAVSVFDDLAKAIQGVDSDDVDKVFGVLSKAGSGAAIGAQVAGGWGALAGAVLGAASGIVEWISGAANEKINAKVRDSELAVKRLENTYKHLEYAIEDAYGTAIIGAQKAAVANKELQLVELKRQLTLEQGRDSKDKDEARIEELKGEIIDLERSIKEAMDNIVNGLLGISSVSDAIEEFMDSYIEAIRNGEDANKVFSQSINDMIANMVKKMIATKILGPWFENTWNTIQTEINARGEQSAKAYEEAQRRVERAKQVDLTNDDSLVEALRELGLNDEAIDMLNWYDENGNFDVKGRNTRLRAAYAKALAEQEKNAADAKSQLDKDTSVTVDDIRKYAELLRSGEPIMDENMKAIEELLKELGLINDTVNDKELSKLQQGISGITEDTAGAIEAYMNIVSQRVFYHGTLLEQIRDAVTGLNTDMQLGVFSQMLLQLQDSYRIQMAIRDILSGWSNPSGLALRVEMV